MEFITKFKDRKEVELMIAYYLKAECPAFKIKGNINSGAVWHHCMCMAQDDEEEHCNCVWRFTKKCFAGEWFGMTFIDEYNKQENKRKNKYLKKLRRVPLDVLSPSDELLED